MLRGDCLLRAEGPPFSESFRQWRSNPSTGEPRSLQAADDIWALAQQSPALSGLKIRVSTV
jgi:hypothetical protein